MSAGNQRTRLSANGERRSVGRRAAKRPLKGLTDHELDAIIEIRSATILRAHISTAFNVLGDLAEREMVERMDP
jgi:hypothetical protein